MFLYFSDWTTPQNLKKLEEQGFPHTGKLIKVIATKNDPSEDLGRQIQTVKVRGIPFEPNERFKWHFRGPWSGSDFEVYLRSFHLPPEVAEQARALFRFADSPEMGIVDLALSNVNTIKNYNHPLLIIHGLEKARDRKKYDLHLDIFTEPSINRLAKVIDLENKEGLITIDECALLLTKAPEGSPRTKESQ